MQMINGGDIFLNGIWVQGLPRSDKLVRRMWYQPLLVPLPTKLLNRDGKDNTLTVVQSTFEPYSLVPRVYFGHYDDLNQVAMVANFLSNTLASTSNLFCLVVGLFMIGAWMASPRSGVFLLAGGSAMTWGILFTLALWPILPVNALGTWRTILYGAEGAILVLMPFFVLHSAGIKLSGVWRIFWGIYACTAAMIYGIWGREVEAALDLYWTIPGVLFYCYGCIRLATVAYRSKDMSAYSLVAVSLICALLAVHDYGVVTGIVNLKLEPGEDWRWWHLLTEPIYLSHLGLPLQLLVTGRMLLSDYRKKVRQVRFANAELQAALQEREVELQRSHEVQRRLIQQETQRREQERIYQDIHDGLGSRLVSLLFMLRAGKFRSESAIHHVEACISDLRGVICAHAEEHDDLQSAVFGRCVALEEQLEGTGTTLTYDIADEAEIRLARSKQLHVIRSVQEMLTNAVKHSGAKSVHVQLQRSEGWCRLSVQDDGCGVPAAALDSEVNGRGIKGLKLRAAALGGFCTWLAIPSGGTRVSLAFPLGDCCTQTGQGWSDAEGAADLPFQPGTSLG